MFQRLRTESMSVGQLFADPNRFIVPMYQRPYCWTIDEAAQLLDDVLTAAGVEDGQVLESDYFLGAILLLDANEGSEGDNKPPQTAQQLEIVDGLQRLVTLMILACALRDLEPTPHSDTANRLDALARLSTEETPDSSRIGLPGKDWNVAFKYIVAPGGCLRQVADEDDLGPGQLAVIAARERLMKALKKLTAEQRTALSSYICDSCHFVVVITANIDRAHRIFMILNDRGRPLLKKDILKAEILLAIAKEHREDALAIWREAESQLGNQMELFLSHLRSAYGYHRMQVISGVRRVVSESGGARAFVHKIFGPLAQAYAMILSAPTGDAKVPPELLRVLCSLSRLSGSDWVPSALCVLSRNLPPARACEYLEEIERAAFLTRIAGLGNTRRQTRFSKVAGQLRAKNLSKPEELYSPPREELRKIGFNLRDLHARNSKVCKALLLRLNDEMQPDAIHADASNYTIEHVLPQRPMAKSLWRDWFPDSEDRAAMTASLGNLVLISEKLNGLASNDEYDFKKKVYSKPDASVPQLAITYDFLKNETCRPEQIRAREATLNSMLNKLWRLELETETVEQSVA